MGTRGGLGFRVDGKDFIAYNHFDSYPEGLGDETVQGVRQLLSDFSLDELRDRVRNIEFVDEDKEPTPEQREKFKQYFENVSNGKDWYSLLRGMQGKASEYVKNGIMIDAHGFLKDSLFCEWAYIINLDTLKLEVYRGFQDKYHKLGRYSAKKERGWKPKYNGENYYYPVALVMELDLTNLPDNLMSVLLPRLKEMDPERWEEE